VIHVAWGLAFGIGRAVGVAFVHQIDNFCIAKSESFFIELMPAQTPLIIKIFGKYSKFSVGAEGCGSILHNGAVVTWDTKVCLTPFNVESIFESRCDVFKQNLDGLISIVSALFMV